MKYKAAFLLLLTLLLAHPHSAQAKNFLGNFCNDKLAGFVKPLTLYKLGIVPDELAQLSDPAYVKNEGSRVRKIFQALTPAERGRYPIEFFRRHIPFVLEILNEIPASKMDERFQFVTADETKMDGNEMSVREAIAHLRSVGENMFSQNLATANNFLEFAYDVLNLADFEKLSMKDLETSKMKYYLKQMIATGVLPWPTFANLNANDFDEWDLGLVFLGFSFKRSVSFDGGGGSRLRFFNHDIRHAIRILRLYEGSPGILKAYLDFRKNVMSEFDKLDDRSRDMMRMAWFAGVHETILIYSILQNIETPKNKDLALSSEIFIYSELETILKLGDGPEFLRKMGKGQRQDILIRSAEQFWEILHSKLPSR